MYSVQEGNYVSKLLGFKHNISSLYCVRYVLLLLILICAWNMVGQLIKPYNHDELHFIFSAVHDVVPSDNLLSLLIKSTLSILEFNQLWVLKFILAVFVSINLVLFYQLIRNNFLNTQGFKNELLLTFLLSLLAVTVQINFRGYDIRPEFLANTIVLLSFLKLLIFSSKVELTSLDYLLSFILLAALGVILLLSLRYAPVVAILTLFFLIVLVDKSSTKTAVLVVLTTIFIFISIIVIFDVINTVFAAASFQANRESFSIFRQLSYGEWWLSFPSKILIVLSLSVWISLIAIYRLQFGTRKFFQIYSFPISLIVSFYAFLILFDKRPFEYVRSIEWLVLFIAVVWILNKEKDNPPRFINAFRYFVGICFLLAGIEAQYKFITIYNTSQIVAALSQSKSFEIYSNESPQNLVRAIVDNSSAIDQFASRRAYCERFPEYSYLVHRLEYHPICLEMNGINAMYSENFDLSSIADNPSEYAFLSFRPGSISAEYEQLLRETHDLYNEVWISRSLKK